jgi:predicted  nucleic acid-binding Zn-ribbon protein
MLHAELELLLEIQDLQTLRRDITAAEYLEAGLPVTDAEAFSARLGERIAEREAQLSPRTQSAYRRIAKRHDRVVAPVLNGVCYGCFVHVPTSKGRDKERNSELRTCESCGRFIYYTD